MLPPHTSALLYASGTWHLPGDHRAPCEGARFHSPTPLFVAPFPLVSPAWDTEVSAAAPRVMLCGTCRDNLAILQQIIAAKGGDIPWEVRREFGNTIRALAERGWEIRQRHLSGEVA